MKLPYYDDQKLNLIFPSMNVVSIICYNNLTHFLIEYSTN